MVSQTATTIITNCSDEIYYWGDGTSNCITVDSGTTTASNCTFSNWSENAGTGIYISESINTDNIIVHGNTINYELSKEEQEKQNDLIVEREKAEEKAKLLLLELIGETELKVYEETGRVFVKGRKFDYIVKKEGMVLKIDKNKVEDMCVQLQNQYKYPPSDNVIALKVMLENDEKKVLNLANMFSLRERPEELPMAACM